MCCYENPTGRTDYSQRPIRTRLRFTNGLDPVRHVSAQTGRSALAYDETDDIVGKQLTDFEAGDEFFLVSGHGLYGLRTQESMIASTNQDLRCDASRWRRSGWRSNATWSATITPPNRSRLMPRLKSSRPTRFPNSSKPSDICDSWDVVSTRMVLTPKCYGESFT